MNFEARMDREEGFPAHIIGFMKRKREKESSGDSEPRKVVAAREEAARPASNA
jgi:hypothetical protein